MGIEKDQSVFLKLFGIIRSQGLVRILQALCVKGDVAASNIVKYYQSMLLVALAYWEGSNVICSLEQKGILFPLER